MASASPSVVASSNTDENQNRGTITFGRDGRDFVMEARQWLPVEREALWRFLGDCRHMSHVIPPFARFQILTPCPHPPLAVGVRYDYRLRLHGIGFRWRTLITHVDHPRGFTDIQERGPYAHFEHGHTFTPEAGGTRIADTIRYRPPGGPLAAMVNALIVRPDLRRLFATRHRRLRELYAPGQADPAATFLDKPLAV